jgi:hypothetical protein
VVCRTQGASCLDWCAAAKMCVGEATYARIMAEREAARAAAEQQKAAKKDAT